MSYNLRKARFAAKLTQKHIEDATGILCASLLAHEIGSDRMTGHSLAIVQEFVASKQKELDEYAKELEESDD